MDIHTKIVEYGSQKITIIKKKQDKKENGQSLFMRADTMHANSVLKEYGISKDLKMKVHLTLANGIQTPSNKND